MGEVRGAQAKNQGAQAFFMKILYTKKKKILDPGGARAPFALCLGPSLGLGASSSGSPTSTGSSLADKVSLWSRLGKRRQLRLSHLSIFSLSKK